MLKELKMLAYHLKRYTNKQKSFAQAFVFDSYTENELYLLCIIFILIQFVIVSLIFCSSLPLS